MTLDTRDRGTRHGAFIAGAWLIAIGLVFLVRDLMDLSWSEGWPLFVIAVGAASLVSSLLNYRRLPAGAWSLLWPLAWIAVGGLLLAATTGRIDQGPGELVAQWWPVALVAIGIWFLVAAFRPRRQATTEHLTIPLAGAPAGEVRMTFGAGELDVRRAEPGALLSGRFEGGVLYRSPGPGFVEIKPDTTDGWPMTGQAFRWDVGLTGEIPLDLRIDTGASRATIDLVDLLVRRLEVRSGASETRVRLPAAAGQSWVRTETGVASLVLEVPPGVAARIRTRMALGRTIVDEARFPRTLDGYGSPEYDMAPNRIDIDIQGGVGSVTVR
jgi:hypothetical protein